MTVSHRQPSPRGEASFWSHRWPAAIAAALVALLAILLRLPECGESFWVDELHTAWAIHDDLADVAGRAAAGNQTPWYFWALWGWRQVAGSSELALRFPSVLALALACAILVLAASRHRGSLLAGILAGGLLAIDLNGIYFGTEARSYAWVVALVAAGLWVAVEYADGRLIRSASPEKHGLETNRPETNRPETNRPETNRPEENASRSRGVGAGRRRLGLFPLSLFAAMLLHPTAGIALLVVLVVGGTLAWQRRQPWSWTMLLAAAAAVVLPLVINSVVVTRVWQVRHHWSRFGVPQSVAELWSMWPWIVALVPLVLWSTIATGRWLCGPALPSATLPTSTLATQSSSPRELLRQLPLGVLLLGGVAGGTLLCWSVAAYGGVPVWHRRYIVGLLPVLCWAAADLWAAAAWQITRRRRWRAGWVGVGSVIAVVMLLHHQQTWQLIRDPRVSLRGEDWRAAVAWVERQRKADQPVYVGAELIESNRLTEVAARSPEWLALREYLLFPVAGPYRIENAQPLASAEDYLAEDLNRVLSPPESHRPEPVRWLVYRMAEPYLESLYGQAAVSAQAPPELRRTEASSRSFGGVTVVRLETHR